MFNFEDLVGLESEAIKTILKVLDKQTLAIALHNAPPAIRDRFFEDMSASQAEAVETEAAQLTFEQTQIADTARQSVVNLVRNFAAQKVAENRVIPLIVLERKLVRYGNLLTDGFATLHGRAKSRLLQRLNSSFLKSKSEICKCYNVLWYTVLINSCL